jgi:hypothetical protein
VNVSNSESEACDTENREEVVKIETEDNNNNTPEHIFCKFIYTGTLNNTPEHIFLQIYIHRNTIYKCFGKNINNFEHNIPEHVKLTN